ncbi:MAG: hypothetical protein QOE05_2878 [Actinomycetota bacterium]|jgi:EAL domain-containing protein (putative c-di-GMP-specific phosphodiesterase class I)|nr:hypothetical protein [Actinomycetota bacterium]
MANDVLRALAGPSTQRVLELARQHLGMDLAFLSEFTDDRQVHRGLDGDAESFGMVLSDGPQLSETYCRLMTRDEIPNAIPDTGREPSVAGLAATKSSGIASYVGVPVRLADGSLYGSLCAVSRQKRPVDQRDVQFLSMLAELVTSEIEAERAQQEARDRFCALIEKRTVQIALQPIFDISTRALCGVEALSRFPDTYGRPDVVFASAHEAGVGAELERVAAGSAFELLTLLPPDCYLAINLSPTVAIELADTAMSIPDLPFDQLVLEITEHAAVHNYTALRDSLVEARARGLRLAIDDAGAGFASLQHIVELQPDIIKIDRSLVHGASANSGRRSVIKAFVTLAADLEASVVAEGVEDAADLSAAEELGATSAQGYLLGRPTLDRQQLIHWQAAS